MKETENMASQPMHSDSVTAGAMEVKDDLEVGIVAYLGVGPSMTNRREYFFFLAASILVSLGIVSALGYFYLWPHVQPYYALMADKEKIGGILRAAGNWAPVVYILFEVVQVLTMFWPVPWEIAGGYLFGLPLAMLYSTAGLTLGAVLAFLLGRWLEKTYLRRIIDPGKLQSFRNLLEREGALAALIIYLIPGIPKDFMSYVLGFSSLSLQFFVVAVIIFRLPSTFLMALQGAEVAAGHYWLSVGLIACNYLLAILIYRHREYLYQWIKAWRLEED
jgi:uncharacterized membrane protein YdjX (TVP38/TMEM64 family)